MPNKPKPGKPDGDNPEWTKEKFARAKRFHELPPELQAKLKQPPAESKPPSKVLISVRLSADVLSALRAQGPGWQTLIDDTLRRRFVAAVEDGSL